MRKPLLQWLAVSRRRGRVFGLIVISVLGFSAAALASQWFIAATGEHRLEGIARFNAGELVVQTESSGVRRITLLGITIPDDWAATSHAAISELIHGRAVLVVFDVESDREGVTPALVYRDDGLLLNEHLLDRGLARYNGQACQGLGAWFGRIEGFATSGGRGLWAD